MMGKSKYEVISELARRRGFFWQSFEIYGGMGGFIDLGPIGSKLKQKLEDAWRDFFVKRNGIYEVSTPIINPRIVFQASGHLDSFKDPMVECTKCGRKYRADHLLEDATGTKFEAIGLEAIDAEIEARNLACPECGGRLSKARYFLTMFETTIGPYSEAIGYARPETAQGIFIDFKRLYEIARGRLPFGVAQIGKALRNEISPRQGPIRLREFTLMEIEFFFDPEEECAALEEVEDEVLKLVPASLRERGIEEPIEKSVGEAVREGIIVNGWLAFFMAKSKEFICGLGIPEERQRFHEKLPNERAHYSAQTFDHEVLLEDWGWVEIAGHAYRTDYDLSRHSAFSGQELKAFKAYERPRIAKALRIVPNEVRIREAFGERYKLVMEALTKARPEDVKASIESKGYFEALGERVTPEHISFRSVEVKETGRRFTPHVVEPSFGLERIMYAVLEHSYSIKEGRVVLRLPKRVAPIQAVVLPLVNREDLEAKAKSIWRYLLEAGFDAEYDDSGSIGRRYARADEIGVPIAITVDQRSLMDGTVTLRERDSWKQMRVRAEEVPGCLKGYLSGDLGFEEIDAS
ncbi:MAG: glycine--tRNA ligase [Candidatus Bathyarchaeia archaeon]